MSDVFPAELLTLVRVLLALLAVLALAVVSLRWILPRWQRRAPAGRSARRLRVLEVHTLDRDHRVALLRVARARGEREVLIAVGAGGSSYLDSWSVPGERPAEPAEEVAP